MNSLNSLLFNSGFQHIVIKIISYLDIESFMNIRKVNKTFLSLIDNELFLWRNALKQMHPIDMTKILTEENEKDKIQRSWYKYNCVCIQRWKEVSKPFCNSLLALKLLVPYIFEVHQRHFTKDFVKDPKICWTLLRTPWHQTCCFASEKLLELIINHLATTDDDTITLSPQCDLKHKWNVFDTACISKRLEAVKLVWKIGKKYGIDFTQKFSPAMLPLFAAFASRNPSIFKFVLDQEEIDINAKDHFNCPNGGGYRGKGRTIMHKIASFGNHNGWVQHNVKIMLANCQGRHIDWNAQDDNGDTPLMVALKTARHYKSEESDYGYYLEALEDLKNLLEAAETPFDMYLPNRFGLTAWDYVLLKDTDKEIVDTVKMHIAKITK